MSDQIRGKNIRRILLFLLLVGFTILVTSRFTSAANLLKTLTRGQWQWIAAGVATHIIYFAAYAFLYQFGFSVVGVQSKAIELLPVVFTSILVNAVAPSGGAGGAALFVDHAVHRGQNGARAAVGVVLVLIVDLGTLLPFILIGALFLYGKRDLQIYDIIGGVFFVSYIGILSSALVLARWSPATLRSIFDWLQALIRRIGSWFNHPHLVKDNWARNNANDFADGANAIAENPRKLGWTLLWGGILHVINLAGLYMFFQAFQQPVRLGTLIAGFGIGIIFFVITVIPQGVGAVEGVMSLVFTSLGISKTNAVVIALSFRGVNFWIPLLIGLIFLRRVTSRL